MTQSQTPSLEQFSAAVRARLSAIDSGLQSLQSRVAGDERQAEDAARRQLAQVSVAIAISKTKIQEAEAQVAQWALAQKAATGEAIAQWKAAHDLSRLQARAAQAERYALAARDVAVAALNRVHQAALEAYLANKDASAGAGQS